MKFKIKKKIVDLPLTPSSVLTGRKSPNHGDLKEVKKFAFKPKRINDIIIWLETYYEVYEFQVVMPNSYNYVKQLADRMRLPVIYDKCGWYFKEFKIK